MTLLIKAISENPAYKRTLPAMERIRDAVKGQEFIKAKGERYLKPSQEVSGDVKLFRNRYAKYIEGAVFDGFVNQTMRSMVGKLAADKMQVETDDALNYLQSDIDADGTTIESFIEMTAEEVLQLKWCVGIADYKGMTDLDADQVSVADLELINPRATIKQYTRDNVIDWDFERINGVMQLSFIMLREVSYVLDKQSLTRRKVISYVICALDDDGFYYQEKLTQNVGRSGGYIRSERNYPQVQNTPLTWIPAYIFSDSPIKAGEMPEAFGMLSPLVDIAFDKYRVSADQKEAIRFLAPTTYIFGMDAADLDVFEMANGRKHIETGAGCVNVIPGANSKVEVIGANTAVNHYADYLETQDRKVRALGGAFKTMEGAEKTATEAAINSSEQNAVLSGMDYSIRNGLKKLIAYCAMFDGLVSPDDVEAYADDSVMIKTSVEYGAVKLTPDEVRATIELYREGAIDLQEFLAILSAGGRLVSDPELLANRMGAGGEIGQ